MSYVSELIGKNVSHVNTLLGTLLSPFIYAAPCEWNKLSGHIRTSNFDCFRKSVKTMLFTQQYRAD